MLKKNKIKTVLLFASSMTVMAGAIIAPSLTDMAAYFADSSDVLIKLIITMPALMIAIFGTLMGTLSDKLGRKNVLVTSLIIYGIGGFGGYLINDITSLLISRAVLGIGVAGIMSSATTLIGDYFEGTERSSFMGTQSAFMSLGGVIFLIVGGFLADMNWRFPFSLYLMAFVILPFAIAILYEPTKVKMNDHSDKNLKSNSRLIAIIYILGFLGMVFFYMIPTQIPFLLQERTSVSNTLVGIAIAVSTFTAAIASLNYGRIKKMISFQKIFAFAFLLIGIGYFFIAFNESYLGIVLGLGIAGLGVGILLPNGNVWLMELAPASSRGKMIGAMSSMMFLGQFVSPLLVALVISKFNLTYAFYIAFAAMIVLAIALYFSINKNEERPLNHER